jgi:uncharacterized protein (TIGR00255 family)
MLYSMTGFGKASTEHKGKTIMVEIRAVNSKNLDIKLKLPNAYKAEEMEVRRRISQETERGKIDITVQIQDISGESHIINHALFAAYSRELKHLCKENGIAEHDILRSTMMLPNIFDTDEDEATTESWDAISDTFDAAIANFNVFRKQEGDILMQDFLMRNDLILNYMESLIAYEGERIVKLRAKLEKSIQDWVGGNIKHFDENRIEQELLFQVEKLDITEEKTRLRQHCAFFLAEINETAYTAKGRKLNFITQEMGREINTIGSKANHAEMQRIVVNMKDELEKIKEQINNIL